MRLPSDDDPKSETAGWTHSLQKVLPRLIRLDRNNNSRVENEKYSQSRSDVQDCFGLHEI